MQNGSLTVVGTGMMIAGQITQEALSYIRKADKVFFVVADAATKEWLVGLNENCESLYDSYREGRPRLETYEEMVERILVPVRRGQRVVAAFYGHPGVFVNPSHEAVKRAGSEGFRAQMLPGVSAEDCLFADLGFDPGERGCQSFEATDFLIRHRVFDPTSYLILWQIGGIGIRDFRRSDLWNQKGLEVLSEELCRSYPSMHEVIVYEASSLPICRPVRIRTPISELPSAHVTLRSTLCVPPLEDRPLDEKMLERF